MLFRQIIRSFLVLGFVLGLPSAMLMGNELRVGFYGEEIQLTYSGSLEVAYTKTTEAGAVEQFYSQMLHSGMPAVAEGLLAYREAAGLSDWIYYQLVRKTAQQLAPKADNYYRYTLYKWYLLVQSGYDAQLAKAGDKMLLYVQSNDSVYNIPFYYRDGRQYVCLNIHDYNYSAGTNQLEPLARANGHQAKPFSYRVTQLPDFKDDAGAYKDLNFTYRDKTYTFKIKASEGMRQAFTNYPVLDYGTYFNIPLSKASYQSLVPELKKAVAGLSVTEGVNYLMDFTRYTLRYQNDEQVFGHDKRMGAEETLLSNVSDCDDRVALLYTLIKEIYNLPMLALVYPDHIMLAVAFNKPVGRTVQYGGKKYSLCEATPQKLELSVGEVLPAYKKQPYNVAFSYEPSAEK